MDMAMRVFLFFAGGMLLLSCGRGGLEHGDAGDAVDSTDAIDSWDDISRDDSSSERENDAAPGDGDLIEDQFLADCNVLIRDCGPGCRQVTCAASPHNLMWDIWGSTIVYFSCFIEYPGCDFGHYTLYRKDLNTNEENVIFSYSDLNSYPWWQFAMYEDKIVHSLHRDFDEEVDCLISLQLFSLSSNTESELNCFYDDTTKFGNVDSVDIFGSMVVWSGDDTNPNPDWSPLDDVYTMDLVTMEKRNVTKDLREMGLYGGYGAKIWGRNVVFYNGDIFLIDLDTMNVRNLTDHPSDQWEPDIWEDGVVWTDLRNGSGDIVSPHNSDIYWCELPDCVPEAATTNWASQEMPTIGGDWIAWIDYRNDVNPVDPASSYHTNLEIWGYNVATGQEHQLVAFENTTLWRIIRIENNKLYFPGPVEYGVGAIFEVDLSQF